MIHEANFRLKKYHPQRNVMSDKFFVFLIHQILIDSKDLH